MTRLPPWPAELPAHLTAPEVRLVLGAAGLFLSGLAVDDHSVGRREEVAFHAVNDLPERLHRPAWVLMQAGTLGAAPAAGVLAYLAGRRVLAAELTVAGSATWLASKAVKRIYRRPRPASLVSARRRGADAAGLGYVSGHAGVAVALASAAWPYLPRPARAAVVLAAPAVGLCRLYVGAHLPLDVLGGAALGLAVEGAVTTLAEAGARSRRARPGRRPTVIR